ncbi:MAG: TolC family protein [Verrucomicrobia bacterium]|nr:TolC family protein [Verrucomicrobiota bacterium]
MICDFRSAICAALVLACTSAASFAQPKEPAGHPIDLAIVLRLAGAQNLDVEIAREKLAEAKAGHEAARAQFFPWISPGLGYRRHDGNIQDVAGNVIDTSKQSYTVGGTIGVQLELGDAIYKTLAAKQVFQAAGHALEAQRQESIFAAAQGYFDLLKAQAAVGVAGDALKISRDYADQVARAVEAGIAFKGDALRAKVQAERNQMALQQAREQRRVASARLAQVLHLPPAVELIPAVAELAPLTLGDPKAALDSLVAQALAARPELRQSDALVAAARKAKDGAVYGPLVPSLGAQAFLGGLGGGFNHSTGNFGDSEDYLFGLSWRIGPGGIGDGSRIRLNEARLGGLRLADLKLRDEIARQVVEARVRAQSLAEQLKTARSALAAAEETLKLTRGRKEFAVGIVLENIQSEQELTRARHDYLALIAEHNKAHYALERALGRTPGGAPH